MKINTSRIVSDHISTLRDASTNRVSLLDLTVFYIVPVVTGLATLTSHLCVSSEVYNVSITFFGIFIALLLNMQVAAFGIFTRKWENPNDKLLAVIHKSKLSDRTMLLREINSNISYLILVSCFALVWFLALFVGSATSGIWPAVSVAIYSHFIATLLMVVKRVHVLFLHEYSE